MMCYYVQPEEVGPFNRYLTIGWSAKKVPYISVDTFAWLIQYPHPVEPWRPNPRWHGTEVNRHGVTHFTDQRSAYPPGLNAG